MKILKLFRGSELNLYIERKYNLKKISQIIIHENGQFISEETSLEGYLKDVHLLNINLFFVLR
jgi:hypothetical protein